jgi:RHS repeat-associated protein
VSAAGNFGNMPVSMPIAALQYDANGRLSGMTMDSGNGPQPFASATYTPPGQLYQLSYGMGTETRTYNSIMQLITQSLPGYMNMTYNYSSTQNNGRIIGSTDGITGENTTYTYDGLNRLTAASNSQWSQSYGYDGFGNLTSKSQANGSPNPSPAQTWTYNANNQQSGMSYDANGNAQPGICNPCSYSVENRLTMEVIGQWPPAWNQYAYDPWGKRVMNGSDPDPYDAPNPTYTYNFYGITGQRLATVNCNASNYPTYPTCAITGQNVYFGGKLIVSGGVNVVTDRLGSVRANGQGDSFAYYPYGEERTSTANGLDKFGTYFRDAVGQDYADQRYYGSGTGAFLTADRMRGSIGNPGSLNRYGYAGNDPVNNWDPSGMGDCPAGQVCVFDNDEGGGSDPTVYICPMGSDLYNGECAAAIIDQAKGPQGGGGGPARVTAVGQALGTLKATIQNLGPNCQKVLPSEQTLLTDASQLQFLDAQTESTTGNQTIAQAAANLAPYNPPGTLSSVLGGNNAITLNGPNNSISNTVLLSSQFFLDPVYGSNANFSVGQGVVLLHELLHYATQLGDAAFVSQYGITKQDQYESNSSAISAWLQNGCKN